MENIEFAYLVVGIWYGTYALLSFVMSCLFRRLMVIPILAHCSIFSPRTIWKESLIWGFWISWQYFFSIPLLTFYKVPFWIIRKCTGYDVTSSSLWTEKERRFYRSTFKSLLLDWTRDHFAKYYPEWKPHT